MASINADPLEEARRAGRDHSPMIPTAVVALAAVVVYLCWRILSPFLASLCWALALAIIADPIKAWLIRRSVPRAVSALIIILVVIIVMVGPGVLLAKALLAEASQIVNGTTLDQGTEWLRGTLRSSAFLAPVVQWLDARFDLPSDAIQIARSLAGWVSAKVSAVLAGSIWLLSQAAVTCFVLFYFLRDGDAIVSSVRSLIPFPDSFIDAAFTKVNQIIRVSLAGKLVVASIQGTLGGLIFYWLGLPAPVFWGTVMAALSIFPVIGAFAVWVPAAIMLAAQDDWKHALALVAWGIVVIHPVDNVLGPVLVGSTLRLHTLLVFFSVIGGIAAFGPSGVVLGPVTMAIAVTLVNSQRCVIRPAATHGK